MVSFNLKNIFNKSTSNKNKSIYGMFSDSASILTEKMKGLVSNNNGNATFLRNNDIGIPHPFDYSTSENLYKKYGLITAFVDKIIDFTIGPGLFIECEDKKCKELLDNFIEDSKLTLQLRPSFKDALLKGSGYIEVGDDGNKNILIKPLNANTMYVKRNNQGMIEKFTQYFGNLNKGFNKNNLIEFTTDEIAQFNINPVGDSAYGLGYVQPSLDIINNFLSSQKSIHVLMKRKAGSPIHVKIGDTATQDIPSENDIQNFGKTMQVMNEKTEWVTGPNVEMKPLDFGNLGARFEAILDNDFLLMSYAFQVPEVLMGKGSVPEGLAKVQMDAFERRIKSYQEGLGIVIKEKILKAVLQINNLNVKFKLKWGQASKADKLAKLEKLKNILSINTLSHGLSLAIEKDIAQTLNYNLIEIEQINLEDQAKLDKLTQKNQSTPQNKTTPQNASRNAENQQPILKTPGQQSKEKMFYLHNSIEGNVIESSAKLRISEWVNYNLADVKDSIIAAIGVDKFERLSADNNIELAAGYLSKKEIGKLREVMSNAFKKDMTMNELENELTKKVNIKALHDYTDKKVKDNILINAKARTAMIARSESVRLTNIGAINSYKTKGVKEHRWIASLGPRTCPICERLNGEVVPLNESFSEGVLYPPVHAFCRCITAPANDKTYL